MQTKITALFGIDYPILLTGMSWISVPKLVGAVSNAGGLGILATGPLTPDETRTSLRRIRDLTDKPFGAGITLLMPGSKENAEVALEEKVPVINYSLGKGDWLASRAHEYGAKVIATVVNHKHAKAAERGGADALLVTGHEAAAHGGDVTSLVLIPSISDAVGIPIVAAGGFGDGRGLVAALSLGAEGIAMGSRFSVTKESPVHDNAKDHTLEKGIEDTIYSNKFDGLYCRMMKTASAEKAIKKGMHLPRAVMASVAISKLLRIPWFKLALGTVLKGPKMLNKLALMATAFDRIEKATNEGDLNTGVHLIGQVQGLITDVPSVAELVNKIIDEAKEVKRKTGIMID